MTKEEANIALIESNAHEVVMLLADAGAEDWYDGDVEEEDRTEEIIRI